MISDWLNLIGEHPNDITETVIERYVNYRTQQYQAQILGFRNKLHSYSYGIDCIYTEKFLKEFDEYFNITTNTHGSTHGMV